MFTTRNVKSSRRGVTLVYMMMTLTAMCAVTSLAVDYGVVQLSKMELRRCADAAARAGAHALGTSNASGITLALQYAAANKVNGQTVTLDATQGDVQLGQWVIDPTGKTAPYFLQLPTNSTSINAVRVVAHLAASRGTGIPMLFAKLLGVNSCDVSAESIAMYIPSVNLSPTVQATANPFLSGMPVGSTASETNPHHNADYAGTSSNLLESPAPIGMTVSAGQSLTFDAISGTAGHDPTLPSYQPDGELDNIGHNNLTTLESSEYGSTMYSENGIADMWCPINALVGVFLDDKAPNATATPSSLDFSSDASRDFQTLQPQLKQLFFIGDGLRADGTHQKFVAPPGATRLFLATWDFYEWNNNYGNRTVKVNRPAQVITVK